MKSKTNAKKLEFKKQTLARLENHFMMKVLGGDNNKPPIKVYERSA